VHRLRVPALSCAVPVPQVGWRGEFFERQLAFEHAIRQRAITKQESISVAGDRERHVQQLGIFDGLAHAGAKGVIVVLGLDDGDGHAGPPAQHVVSAADGLFVPRRVVAAHHDPPGFQGNFLEHLLVHVPVAGNQRRRDELQADVSLGKALLVHAVTVGPLVHSQA